MKNVYVMKAFDTRNFKYVTPTVSVFTSEKRAKQMCDDQQKTDPTVILDYEETFMNEEEV